MAVPKLIPESGQLTSLACSVATIGNKIEQRISALFAEKHASLAMALDELGNQLVFAVARCLGDCIYGDVIGRKLTWRVNSTPENPVWSLMRNARCCAWPKHKISASD